MPIHALQTCLSKPEKTPIIKIPFCSKYFKNKYNHANTVGPKLIEWMMN